MNKKGLITIGTLLGMLTAVPFLSSAIIGVQTTDQIYSDAAVIPAKEVALVLGAAVKNGQLSDILRDRVDTGIELFENQKIISLIMSGGPNETGAMKQYAVSSGVPAEVITEDPLGLNTMASMKNVLPLNRSMILVTQRYHLHRALFIANNLGLDAVGMSADKRTYLKMAFFKMRELLATSKDALTLTN